jgi:hypothetical protein
LESNVIFFRQNNLKVEVEIPDCNGETHPHLITWIRPLYPNEPEKAYYEVSCKGTKYPYDVGHTAWIMQLMPDGQFVSLSCSNYFTEKEFTLLSLVIKLGMSQDEIRDRIYKERITS